VLVEDTDDFGHLSFDSGETLVRLSFQFRVKTIRLGITRHECRLVLNKRRHCLIQYCHRLIKLRHGLL
jgi:hypothetical protein